MVMVITVELERRTFEKNNNCYANCSSDIMSNRELRKFTKKRDNIFSCIFSNTFIFISRICNNVSKVQSNIAICKLYYKSLAKKLLSGISKKVQITWAFPTNFTFFMVFGKYLNFELLYGHTSMYQLQRFKAETCSKKLKHLTSATKIKQIKSKTSRVYQPWSL